ncbi:hypothetical protein [Desertivirga brevis]|uniref:hypothetical protein n=1 Tax=Desertivirga brevis TaxID=2810310 RepID=UPI001A958471|nr:hypothetical protein [Pedobacter sp. SYSU D00873]
MQTDFLQKSTAYFVNGMLVDESMFRTIKPAQLQNIKIEKDVVELDGTLYQRKIYSTVKEGVDFKLISIRELIKKHVEIIEKRHLVVLLDVEIVNGDYDKININENALLRLIIKDLKNPKEGLDVKIIELLTKTTEKIKKVNQ